MKIIRAVEDRLDPYGGAHRALQAFRPHLLCHCAGHGVVSMALDAVAVKVAAKKIATERAERVPTLVDRKPRGVRGARPESAEDSQTPRRRTTSKGPG